MRRTWLALTVMTALWAAAPMASWDAAPQAKESRVKIMANKVRYDRLNKLALATGEVKIIQEDTTIFANEVQYDEGAKMSYINDPLKAIQTDKETGRKTVLTGDRMTAFHEEKRILVEHNVKLDREADRSPRPPKPKGDDKSVKRQQVETALKRARTIITADALEYWTRAKDAAFNGNVKLLQDEKRANGDRALLNDAQGTITLTGKAHLEQINGNWLVVEGIVDDDPKDEELQRALKNKAEIDADEIVINQNTNDVYAKGHVRVQQKGRVATGDECIYNDRQELITVTGNVKLLRENGDWMTADRILVHTARELFEAFGGGKQIESEFTIPEEEK